MSLSGVFPQGPAIASSAGPGAWLPLLGPGSSDLLILFIPSRVRAGLGSTPALRSDSTGVGNRCEGTEPNEATLVLRWEGKYRPKGLKDRDQGSHPTPVS